VRMERDRRGGLRVFQGQALVRTVLPRHETTESGVPIDPEREDLLAGEDQVMFIKPVPPVVIDVDESDVVDMQPESVVDTTAELLGRAKPRRPRGRAAAALHAGNTEPAAPRARKSATKRAPAARKPRAKKTEAPSE